MLTRLRPLLIAVATLASGALPAAAQPAAAPPAKSAKETSERFQVETADGATIAAWAYPIPEEASPLAIVILLHDLGGSHRSVEPLAKALQAAGCVVVAPDLRGHGDSPLASLPGAQADQAKLLKKNDFEMMAATRGGRVRDQSGVRGDVECIRNWIRKEIAAGRMPEAPLAVVGSGVGAAVAAHWTAADSLWPDIASGPQGREVAALVLIAPSFATRGFSITPAFATDALKRSVPTLIIAGSGDRDAIKVFDQLKKHRPKGWFDSRHPVSAEKNPSPVAAGEASLLLLCHPAERTGDALATLRSADQRGRGLDPATLIPGFLKMAATAAASPTP
jgi:alpha-beta hydrolase superfamily lysophospholipase